MPRVSVLLTSYNHLAYLPACIGSVRDQTFSDWEVVAVDDGSTDGSREWLTHCDVPMTRVFNETNLGSYASLNKALAASQGEYVAVLNDDDVWMPEKLAAQVDVLNQRPNTAFVHTACVFVDQKGEPLAADEPLGFPPPKTGNGDVLASLVERNRVVNSAALIRRSHLIEAGCWDESFYGCGDWHLWLRLARKHDVGFVDEPLTLYRIHPANASHATTKMDDDSRRIREWIASWPEEDLPKRVRAFNWAALAEERLKAGDKPGARLAAKAALRGDPLRLRNYARWLTSLG